MIDIKVGQVYEYIDLKFNHTKRLVITMVSGKCLIYTLFNDGYCNSFADEEISSFMLDCELIAEYPTWQEAVNSKEFKGE